MPDPVSHSLPRLDVRNLSKSFGEKPVVKGVSFSLAAGEVTCLLGSSGCGKSTTLRMIAGVETPDGGEILIDGVPIFSSETEVAPEKRSVGLMFQDFALFPHLSVAKNIAYGLARKSAETDARVKELLERVGLEGYGNAFPHELSGGEQQRVALARALAPRPSVMLMDEPFSGLDERLRDDVRARTFEILKEEGASVLMVTHAPVEAMQVANEIVLMRAGNVVQLGSPYNLYNAPVDLQAAAFFSDLNVIEGRVKGALTETVFGKFLTPGHPDGTRVRIAIRPQHLKMDFDRNGRGPNPTDNEGIAARAEVISARFLGRESRVEFRVDGLEAKMQATVPTAFLPKPGTPMWLMIRRDRCFVFAD